MNKKIVAAVVSVSMTAGAGATVAHASPSPGAEEHAAAVQTEELADQPFQVTFPVEHKDFKGDVTVRMDGEGSLSVVTAPAPGSSYKPDTYDVLSFTLVGEGEDDFAATVRSRLTGEVINLDTTEARATAVPALIVLAIVARIGLRFALKRFTRMQVKRAAKSYLLRNVDANKWNHIMAPKHRWGAVGAKSREQVAELMSRAMAEGRHHVLNKDAGKATWSYRGETITVTYNRKSGKISNGWVNR